MKALIFGTTGQVARELDRRTPHGVQAIRLGRDEADLTDPETCVSMIGQTAPDVVINAAAYTAVDRAEAEEPLATTINGTTPGAMARSCADRGIPFLHVSTDYVFDGSGDTPWAPDAPTGPLNAYGRSKLAGEEAIRAAGGPHAILRTSWVVSAHGSNFVRTMLRLSESREELRIVDDQVGGPTPAADIARALWTMAQAMVAGQGGGTYHFAGQPAVSWAGFAEEILARAGRAVTVTQIPTAEYPTPAARPLNSRLDCAKLTADFGITPSDWKAGLADILKDLS
ncbi:dTDP-4-dehydrorhamnose reductase [Pseudoponticoccus marisrubri]|uniref:dTDP-4-dehydrorhamnose reductase n=1 Tax=Pseudoponticoccus marisrubri TaxID=1685382 RepID=A0A0W7WI31_9RHOB|nr:dTDP-4-dehydrorhamnose reductase [Pseudoponticoccus marisrubri]KUF10268.1 dTDP-4-dehydrorhamnose reductase [Pseudoponticoccus marisrubri]